jgi:putative ABC transport system substrate-binding protein
MRRRTFLGAVSGSAVLPAWAQSPMPTIGVLATTVDERVMAPMRRGLEAGGYVEGRNVTIVYRSAEGQFDRLPALAAELVARPVSVIYAWGSPLPTRAAKAATTTIPIVFGYGGDPVADGMVPNFNRPGGNVTGVTMSSSDLVPKRLELVRRVMPNVTEVGLLVNTKTGTLAQAQIKDAERAAPLLGLGIHLFDVSTAEEVERAFATVEQRKLGAMVLSTDPLFGFGLLPQIVESSVKHRVPTIYASRVGPDAGGLIGYGTNPADAWRQSGVHIARVLKGEKPGDLPIIQGTRFETVVNLKTAKALGLDIPASVLAAADEVIE